MGHKYVKEEETFNTSRNGTVPKPTAEEISAGKVLGANGTWISSGGDLDFFTVVDGKVCITYTT